MPDQSKFIDEFHKNEYNIYALSVPRGNGKSFVAARIIEDLIHPDSPHYQRGQECLIVAGSVVQAGITFKYLRDWLEPSGLYSWRDNDISKKVTHKKHHTSCRVMSSKAKMSFGIGQQVVLIADEPRAWEVSGGELLQEAIDTSLGKPGTSFRVVYIGTQSPAARGWWPSLCQSKTRR